VLSFAGVVTTIRRGQVWCDILDPGATEMPQLSQCCSFEYSVLTGKLTILYVAHKKTMDLDQFRQKS
ncbi:uncharacterized protein METZ01_LOCUS291706, partial [marine metagenome]